MVVAREVLGIIFHEAQDWQNSFGKKGILLVMLYRFLNLVRGIPQSTSYRMLRGFQFDGSYPIQ